jgi:hypothetical protein
VAASNPASNPSKKGKKESSVTRDQFEEIRTFTRSLTQKRLQMPDGQLLDLCQQHLDALVAHLAEEFEEHPQDEPERDQPATAERLLNALRAEPSPEPEPPPPVPSHPEPLHEVRHTVAHKRPTPRKTHR